MDAAVALAAWLFLVLVTAIVVVYLALRWGRDPFGWLLLSGAMGPIALIALVATRQRDVERPARSGMWADSAPDGERPVAIIAAADGSAASERVAEQAAAAASAGERVAVFTVLPREAEPRRDDDATTLADRRELVERATGRAVALLRARGADTCVVVGYGVPGEEIVRYAGESGARLVIVGRRGAGMTRALLGSVSEHVVTHGAGPVLVAE